MHYTYTTPPSFRAADRPTPIDDALVADARRLMTDAVESLPPASSLDRSGLQALFAPSMATLCAVAPENVPVEKLIVAVKLAWASMAEARLNFGETGSDALSGAVSACIEAYFLRPGTKAD
jgi:hypothetical protein